MRSGRLPPSLLFTGPEGAGKELFAIELAAMLNCGSQEEDGERHCPSCMKVGNLEHPDLHIIYAVPYGEWEKAMPIVMESRREDFFNYGEFGNRARSIGIDLIRKVIESVSKRPYEGHYTVVILFEAHLMTVGSQNAFLKLLEEPPASAVILLVTDYPDRLLPTILSRCQQVRFDPLPVDGISDFLVRFYSVKRKEARRLALLSDGNLRRSIKLLDEGFLEVRRDATSILQLVIDGKAKELLAASERCATRYAREEVSALLDESARILRLLLRAQAGEVSKDEISVLEEALGKQRIPGAEKRDLPADLRRVYRAAVSIRKNADIELTLSQLLLDLVGKWY